MRPPEDGTAAFPIAEILCLAASWACLGSGAIAHVSTGGNERIGMSTLPRSPNNIALLSTVASMRSLTAYRRRQRSTPLRTIVLSVVSLVNEAGGIKKKETGGDARGPNTACSDRHARDGTQGRPRISLVAGKASFCLASFVHLTVTVILVQFVVSREIGDNYAVRR